MTLDPWREGPLPDGVLARASVAVGGSGRTPRLPRVGDGVTARVDLLESFAELVAVSMARARFLGELLAEQMDRESGSGGTGEDANGPEGTEGLIGYTYGTATVGTGADAYLARQVTGEDVRSLAKLEAEERDRAAKLIERALKIGITLQQVEMLRSYGTTIAAALQTFVLEIGLSLNDEPVLRAAQRAGLQARRALGHDEGDPDRVVGVAMTPAERVTALREALTAAEADAQRHREVTGG